MKEMISKDEAWAMLVAISTKNHHGNPVILGMPREIFDKEWEKEWIKENQPKE